MMSEGFVLVHMHIESEKDNHLYDGLCAACL